MRNKNNLFDEVFLRLMGLRISTQTELAQIVGATQSSVSDAKRRGSFPKKWVVTLSNLYDKTPEWILGTETTPFSILQEENKDEIIRLMKLIIKLEEDVKEKEKFWREKIQKTEDTLSSLQDENSMLRGMAGEQLDPKKNTD